MVGLRARPRGEGSLLLRVEAGRDAAELFLRRPQLAVRNREEAYLEEASARREAERGTFDPAYVLYSLGKLMVVKLRDDYRALKGDKYSMRAFHDTLLGNGTVPLWLHRNLMLGENNGSMLE